MLNNPILGVDVSTHNPLTQWTVIDRIQARWIYIKATLFLRKAGHSIDEKFLAHLGEAIRRGLDRGPYHWLDSRASAREQAEHHWRVVEKLDLTLRSILDWEEGITEGPTRADDDHWSLPLLEHAEAWVERFRELSGYLPTIYCGKGYVEDPRVMATSSSLLAQCPLIVAAYPTKLGADSRPLPGAVPLVPKIWDGAYDAWQISDGKMHGLEPIDRNLTDEAGLDRLRVPAKEPHTVAREFSADQILLSDAAIPPQKENT